MIQLLRDALYALNMLRKTTLRGSNYADSYELAAALQATVYVLPRERGESAFKVGSLMHHVKSQRHYVVLMTPADGLKLECTGAPAYLYAAQTPGESLWVRSQEEFEDGRFMLVGNLKSAGDEN